MSANCVFLSLMVTAGLLPGADPTLFIAPVTQSSLATYDSSTLAQTSGFLTGGNAQALALASDETTAYVTATAEGAVLRVELTSGRSTQTFSTVMDPVAIGLSPDGTKLYALTSGTDSYLFVFDTASGSRLGKVSAGYQSTSLAVSPDGKKIYVANLFSIIDIDASSMLPTSTVPVVEATKVVFGPSSAVLYAATIYSGQQIEVISTATDSVTGTVPVGAVVVYDLAVSADGTLLYAASTQGLLQISTATNQIVRVFQKE